MSTATQPVISPSVAQTGVRSRLALSLADYAQLTKPRVTSLVVATAWFGYFMAAVRSGIPAFSWTLFHTLLAVGIVSGGAAALNQVIEREADGHMRRTSRRPLPAGRIAPLHATLFGLALLVGGSIYLAAATNLFTGYLAFSTGAVYLLFYTPLKQLTTICTLVGAFPGAMPAALGWIAVRGRLEWEALALFAIVLLWQFPHFFAIAWMYADDYESAGIRMLPVVEKDGRSTTREILLYSASLVPVSLAPGILGMSGTPYLVGSVLLSCEYCWCGWQLRRLDVGQAIDERLEAQLLEDADDFRPPKVAQTRLLEIELDGRPYRHTPTMQLIGDRLMRQDARGR